MQEASPGFFQWIKSAGVYVMLIPCPSSVYLRQTKTKEEDAAPERERAALSLSLCAHRILSEIGSSLTRSHPSPTGSNKESLNANA